MQFGFLLPHYLAWHYTRALRDLASHVRTFLWFFWNLFSIHELLRTFFAPFERLGEAAPKRFNPEQYFEALATTLVMRVVGIVVRSFFILLGLGMLCACALVGCLVFCVWLLLPLLWIAVVVAGVMALLR
ncbi:MAG: hypothetical protein RL150_407 [Candidatus Parcubacteria bacterium]|jgi:ABC-type sugar transport system permease subunit